MKKFSYGLITIGLVLCILSTLSIQVKTRSPTEKLFEYEKELIGDFAKTIIEPHDEQSSIINIK